MKRKVLCVFSLLGYLLLFCSLFAPMAQREMALLVEVEPISGNSYRNVTLSCYSVQWGDQTGLFQVVEGTGWNAGDRVDVISEQYYRIEKDFFTQKASHVTLHPGTDYNLIVTASRMPQAGDSVEVVKPTEHRGEKLIVCTPAGFTKTAPLPNNFTVLSESEKGLLLDTIGIKMPYLEHLMLQSVESRLEADGMRVYSYTDAKTFMAQFPLIALMLGLLLSGIVLWGGTCLLTKKERPKHLLWVNMGATGLTLLLMLPLTKWIDLPASLMPSKNILDIGHYAREFSNIFTTVESVGDQSLQQFGLWMAIASAAIVLVLAALSAAVVLFENKRCRVSE